MITPYRSGEPISLQRMNCIPLTVNNLCSQLRRLQTSSAVANLGKVYHPRTFAGGVLPARFQLPAFQPAYHITTEDYILTIQEEGSTEVEYRPLSFLRVNKGGVASPQGVKQSPTSWFDISPQPENGAGSRCTTYHGINAYIFVVVTTGEVVLGCEIDGGGVPHNRCLWLLACINNGKVQYPTWEGYIWHCMEFEKPMPSYYCSPQIPVWTCCGHSFIPYPFYSCTPEPTITRCFMEREHTGICKGKGCWSTVPCATTGACGEAVDNAYWICEGWKEKPAVNLGVVSRTLNIHGVWSGKEGCFPQVCYVLPKECSCEFSPRGTRVVDGFMYFNEQAKMGCFVWTREPFMRSDGHMVYAHHYAGSNVREEHQPDDTPAGCYLTEYQVYSANATCGYGVQTVPINPSAKYIMRTDCGFECYSATQS